MNELNYTIGSTSKIFKGIKRRTAWINLQIEDKNIQNDIISNFGGKLDAARNEISFPLSRPTDTNEPNTMKFIKVLETLKNKYNYNVPSVDMILEEAESVRMDIASKKNIDAVEANTDELWLKFMKEIEKPETQLLLKSIGRYVSLDDSIFGWRLSLNNIMRIRSQKSDAKFLQTRTQWRIKYNRNVVNDATRILIVAPKDIERDNNMTKSEFMKSIGYNDNTTYDSISHQQKDYVDTSLNHGRKANFHYITVYDISDTVLIPGAEDVWNEEVGFDNNLEGTLNQKAKDFQAQNNNIDDEQKEKIKQLYNGREGNLPMLNQVLKEIMINDYKLPQNDAEDISSNDLVNYKNKLNIISNYLIEKKGKIVKQENRNLSTHIVTTIVMCLTDVSPETVAQKFANNELSNESYYDLRNIINDIIVKINKHMKAKKNITSESISYINEHEYPLLRTVDDLLVMLGMEDKKEEINNNEEINENKKIFYNIFNKLIK